MSETNRSGSGTVTASPSTFRSGITLTRAGSAPFASSDRYTATSGGPTPQSDDEAIQIAARGRAPLPQRRFVVAAPEHPGVLRRAIREPPHVVDERVEARRAAQIEHRRQQMADLPDVRVRIVEAGNERAATEVDARGAAV